MRTFDLNLKKKMKYLKYVVVLVVAMLAFQACNNDDEANEGDIEGTWNVTDLDFDITVNGESLDSFLPQTQADLFEGLLTSTFEESFEGSSIEFKADGTYTTTDSDDDTESGTWSINSDGSVLTLDSGTAEEFSFDIKSSTSSSLVLNYSETDDSQDLDQDGNNDNLVIGFDLTLSK